MLLRVKDLFFRGSYGVWQPDADEANFIKRPAMVFDSIFEYRSSGKLSVEGLTLAQQPGLLPHAIIQFSSLVEGFRAPYI